MNLPENSVLIFYASIGIVIVLEGIALFMIVSYFKLLKSYDSIMKKQKELEQGIKERSEQLLEAAQDQSQVIIAQANTKAQQVVSQAQLFNRETQDKINTALGIFLQEQLVVYKRLFENVQGQTLQQMQAMRDDLTREASQQLNTVTANFEQTINQSMTRANEALASAYKQAEVDIDNYKKQRIDHLNQMTTNFIRRVSERFFQKALSGEQKAKLLQEAIDEAKREQIL
jgi:F0F1-type ATP synthase membrane subunit b/b'